MRILLGVHHRLDANTGAPGATLELGSAYRALGHEVEYASFDDLPARLPDPMAELLYPEAAAWLFAQKGRRADVIDTTTGDAWLWARLPRRGPQPRLVTRSHGLEHVYWESVVAEAGAEGRAPARRTRLYHGGLRLREVAASLRASDMCVFLNQADLDYAVQRLRVPPEHATVVLNGISDELIGLTPVALRDELVIAMIGTWASRKGSRYAADALGGVLARRPEVHAVLLGTHTPKHEVLAAFAEPVRERVGVVPAYERGELPGLLSRAHVLLSASLAEGFSLAIPEGMAGGLAPVATAIPGTLELVRHEENGLLAPPADAAALEAALDRVAGDRALLERLRQAAHRDAQALTWDRIARQNLDVYERALAS